MDNSELHQYCLEWMEWCRTRRYYMAPTPKNILARFQPSPSGTEPNARNDADMQFFNMAVHTLADMKEYHMQFACFHFCYIEGRRGVKREAERLKISRRTYYNYVGQFARRALSMAKSLKSVNEAMTAQQENCDTTVD